MKVGGRRKMQEGEDGAGRGGEGRCRTCFLVMSAGLGGENIPCQVRGEERPLSPCGGTWQEQNQRQQEGRTHRWWVKALLSQKRVL